MHAPNIESWCEFQKATWEDGVAGDRAGDHCRDADLLRAPIVSANLRQEKARKTQCLWSCGAVTLGSTLSAILLQESIALAEGATALAGDGPLSVISRKGPGLAW